MKGGYNCIYTTELSMHVDVIIDSQCCIGPKVEHLTTELSTMTFRDVTSSSIECGMAKFLLHGLMTNHQNVTVDLGILFLALADLCAWQSLPCIHVVAECSWCVNMKFT